MIAPLDAAWRQATRRIVSRRRSQRPTRTPLPVLSVGNVAWGGTAKTPLVRWLVAWFVGRGQHPGVVSRGWGRADPKAGPFVLRARGPAGCPSWRALLCAEDAAGNRVAEGPAWALAPRFGDECAWLAAVGAGSPVAVGPDKGALLTLLAARGCDLAILDDGLQSAVWRDLDLVLVDSNRDLRPGRWLREPIPQAGPTLQLLTLGGPMEGALARIDRRLGPCTDLHGNATNPPPGTWICAGVANPRSIRPLLRDGSTFFGPLPVLDHHAPSPLLQPLLRRAPGVLVTEKDAVGWAAAAPPNPRTCVVGLELEVEDVLAVFLQQWWAARG